uniref:Uncharacterized protein n=1 Tax=Strigamia maritima TaxID=126957 RepID=T1IXL8_STRMM
MHARKEGNLCSTRILTLHGVDRIVYIGAQYSLLRNLKNPNPISCRIPVHFTLWEPFETCGNPFISAYKDGLLSGCKHLSTCFHFRKHSPNKQIANNRLECLWIRKPYKDGLLSGCKHLSTCFHFRKHSPNKQIANNRLECLWIRKRYHTLVRTTLL